MSFSISQLVDVQRAKPFEATVEEVGDLLQHGTCTAKEVLQVAQLVILSVLPRIILAVKEKEATLAASLLGVVEDNATKIQARMDDMQQRHLEMQQYVPLLLPVTECKEPSAACKLAQIERQPDSPRSMSSTEYASSNDGDVSSDDEYHAPGLGSPCEPLRSRAPTAMKAVNEIARIDRESWQNLDEVIQNLVRMKDHTSCLIKCCGRSEKISARVEQRLIEYTTAWATLENSCKQHVAARERSVMLMRDIYSH